MPVYTYSKAVTVRRIVSVRDLSYYYLWACSLMIVTGTTVKNIVNSVEIWQKRREPLT